MAKVIFYPRMDVMLDSPGGEVGRYLIRRGGIVTKKAKSQVGFRTGALRTSIHMRHMRDPRGQYLWIGSTLSYALLHHEGTRPHTIRVTRQKVLKFQSRGKVVFDYVVQHPGTAANRYLSDNLRHVF